MEKMNISSERAEEYVKIALVDLGYLGKLDIETFITDDGLDYMITEHLNYRGQLTKRLIPTSVYNFNMLMKYGMELKGAEVYRVDSVLSNGVVRYTAKLNIVSKGNPYKKKKRRR